MKDARQALADYQEALTGRQMLQDEVDLIRDEILGEKKRELEELEMEYGSKFRAMDEAIAELAEVVKSYVLLDGESVKGERFRASYVKGRKKVDMRALEKIAREDVRVAETISLGKPYVSISPLKH